MKGIICISLATAAVSFTISDTALIEPLRGWIKKKIRFFGKLVSCDYCLGFWISFVMVVILKPKFFHHWWLLDYFLTVLVIAWLSGFQSVLMCFLRNITEKQ
jgi:hypothetical protein